jgi:hypothetical protein
MHSESNCTSLVASVLDISQEYGEAFSKLSRILPAPKDFPSVHRVARGCAKSIETVIHYIGAPSAELLEISSNISTLVGVLGDALAASGTHELLAPLPGLKGRYPAWAAFASLESTHEAALLLAGTELLNKWHEESAHLSDAIAYDIGKASRAEGPPPDALASLLSGGGEDDFIEPWAARLRRDWRLVLKEFSDGLTPPAINALDRIRGQILASATHPRFQKRAGASDHRQLSKLQTDVCLKQISSWIKQGDYRGTVGFFVCCTGLSVELIPGIPILRADSPGSWLVAIDLNDSHLKTDLAILTTEAAQPTLEGTVPSSYILAKPMPEMIATQLRSRLQRFPEARCLRDLYPDFPTIDTTTSVVDLHGEIKPSWARARSSTGTFLRNLGINNLLACLVSGDFGHMPRSKLYYASVSAIEIRSACESFYNAAGWGSAASVAMHPLNFGCQVVPEDAQVREVDRLLQEHLTTSAPGKHCSIHKLLAHHNRYMALTGFRLSMLFAIRELKVIPITANIDETRDLWISIEDKTVNGFNGPLPVPMTALATLSIRNVRVHCRALRLRLEKKSQQYSPLANWCRQVELHQDVPLLMQAGIHLNLIPVGASNCFRSLPKHLRIAPDFGRKIMENHLRMEGIRSTDIDAVLRHSVSGQSPATSVSDFSLLEWIDRVVPAMNTIASQLLVGDTSGLARA